MNDLIRKPMALALSLSMLFLFTSGCDSTSSAPTEVTADTVPLSDSVTGDTVLTATLIAPTYTARDLSGEYDDNVTELTLCSSDVTITTGGTYILSGTLSDGQIIVETADTDKVQIVLNNASVTNSDGPAIYVKTADKVFITLADGTTNTVSDGTSYLVADDTNTPNACIFSKSDLTINGTGTLVISGNYDHAIFSKDDLILANCTLDITAVGDGVKGKDCVEIVNANLTVNAGGDGIQASNTEDTAKGYVSIESGTFVITASGDGIQAETQLQITGGIFTITTGGGAGNASTTNDGGVNSGWGNWSTTSSDTEDSTSAKGLKASSVILITDGTLTLDTSDDSIHSNGDCGISGGTFTIASGDDGAHTDDAMVISGGSITITKSYEGIEGNSINITGGTTAITASDDGINAAGGSDTGVADRTGQNSFDTSTSTYLRISGGTLTINASGDGLDSNGELTVEGGEIYVSGPTNNGNGAIDCGDGYSPTISGGTLVAAGSSGMAETFSSSSTQYSFLIYFDSTISGGTALTVTDSLGTAILTYTPEKEYQSAVISTPGLTDGETYTVTAGDTSTEVTLSGTCTTSGSGGSNGMGGDSAMGGGKGQMGGTAPSSDGTTTTDGTAPTAPSGGGMNGGPGGGGGGTPPSGNTTTTSE